MVTIQITKRHLFLLAATLFIGIVIAYGGNDPTTMGHTAGEMHVDIDGDGNQDKTLQEAITAGDFSEPSPITITSGTKTINPGSWQEFLNTADFPGMNGQDSGTYFVTVGPIDAYYTLGGPGTYDLAGAFITTIPRSTNQQPVPQAVEIPASISAHSELMTGSFSTPEPAMQFQFVARAGQVPGLIQMKLQTYTGQPVDVPYKIMRIEGFSH